jgi:hypothetical protein
MAAIKMAAIMAAQGLPFRDLGHAMYQAESVGLYLLRSHYGH